MTNVSDAFVVNMSTFLYKSGSYSPPSTWYLALCNSAVVSTAGVVSAHYELTGGVYARQALVLGDPDTNGLVSNTTQIDFPQATIDHGTVAGAGLCTAASGAGTIVAFQAFTDSLECGVGARISVPIGALRLSY
jgi:hypothetical protein